VPDSTRSTLLARLKAGGDDEAWSLFGERYRPLILGYALRHGLQYPDAEDVTQVVLGSFARAVRGFSYDARRGRFRAYLRQAVRHAIQRQLERRGEGRLEPPSALDALAPAADDGTGADGLWEAEWRRHHLRLALAELRRTAEPRTVAVLEALLEGRAVDDVTHALGVSRDVVYKCKQRARDRLRELVREQLRDEELTA